MATVAPVTYQPQFPKAHALLLEVYEAALKPESDDSDAWCVRFKAITLGWEALKDEGLLPGIFLRKFYLDIRDVAGRVQEGLDMSRLTTQQKLLTFAIANLQMQFGAK